MLQFSMILVKCLLRPSFAGFWVYTIYVSSCIFGCLWQARTMVRAEKVIF